MSNIKTQNGFTLIELLVVVAIVGVLSAIGISSFQEYKSRAYYSTVQSLVHNGIVDLESYMNSENPINNLSADKRWNIGATGETYTVGDDTLFPTAKVSEGYRLRGQVRTYQCSISGQERYFVQAIPYRGDKRQTFWNECDGEQRILKISKNIGTWWS